MTGGGGWVAGVGAREQLASRSPAESAAKTHT